MTIRPPPLSTWVARPAQRTTDRISTSPGMLLMQAPASGTFDFNALGLGAYTISVSAADADNDRAGDSLSSTASQSVVVSDDDIAGPVITLGGSNGAENDGQDQHFTWNVADVGSGLG